MVGHFKVFFSFPFKYYLTVKLYTVDYVKFSHKFASLTI